MKCRLPCAPCLEAAAVLTVVWRSTHAYSKHETSTTHACSLLTRETCQDQHLLLKITVGRGEFPFSLGYGELHVKYNVVCLAVSKYRGFVLGLGLRRTGRRKHRYKRIGLAFWNANAWDDCNGPGVKECIIV